MATRKGKDDGDRTIEIPAIQRDGIVAAVLGTTPLIINKVSVKAQRELLMPRKKTAADRAMNLKHNPLEEFRESAHTIDDDRAPTLLAMPVTAFKGAMRSAALRIPGATKQEVGEMVYIEGDLTPIYGLPQVFCAITRNSDPGRTPDVRTRCIVPEWCAILRIRFTRPILNATSVGNLLAWAGATQGIGDGRTNKGWGNYGSYEVVEANHPKVQSLMKNAGRVPQLKAMKEPTAYDDSTNELLQWFDIELKRRGNEQQSPPAKKAVKKGATA